MLTITIRGLELEIPEAEIFSELDVKSTQDKAEQREVAYRLFLHYMDNYNHDKAVKYAILATGGKPTDVFKLSFTDAFNWYNVLRVFVGSINRVLSLLVKPFLPIWYPLTGLFYGVQALVAHKEGNKENEFYWTAWMIFNGFSSLVLFGVLAASGVGLPIAALAIALYSFVFDVKWDVYKYATERAKHENLLGKLNKDLLKGLEDKLDTKTFNSLKNKSDNELLLILEKKLDEASFVAFKSKLINDPNRFLKHKLVQDIKKMKGDRIEAGMIDTAILIGGFLFCLSAFLPPVFASLGASFIFGAFSYLVAKKTYNSWTSPTGFLNNFVRQPLNNFFNRCSAYLKNTLKPKVSLESSVEEMDLLRIDTTRSDLTQPLLANEPQSPVLNTSTSLVFSGIDSKLESRSPRPALSPETVEKLNNAKYFVDVFMDLPLQEQQEVKKALTSEMKMDWNKVLEVHLKEYKDQKPGDFYTCTLKQSIRTCIKHFQDFLWKEKRKGSAADTDVIEKLNHEIQFLKAREEKCFGIKSDDFKLIDVSENDFRIGASLDYENGKSANIHLLHLLGIDDYAKYEKQMSHYEKYYNNNAGKRISSPFLDRGLTCGFEAERLDQPTQTTSITVSV